MLHSALYLHFLIESLCHSRGSVETFGEVMDDVLKDTLLVSGGT